MEMTAKTKEMIDDEQFTQVEEYANVIMFKHKDGPTSKEKYTARTIPNQRLHRVFGIGSSFTNPDPVVHNKFVREATAVMNKATGLFKAQARHDLAQQEDGQEDWTNLRSQAIKYCHEYCSHPSNDQGVNLSGLVQFVTLKLSLDYLFPGEISLADKDFANIIFIGNRINELWVESKKGEGEIPDWQHETKLQDALRRIFKHDMEELIHNDMARIKTWQPLVTISALLGAMGSWISAFKVYRKLAGWLGSTLGKPQDTTHATRHDPTVPQHNPMNLILPAYETMWRVVMRCFIEIRYRSAPDGPGWSNTMTNYIAWLKDPRREPGQGLRAHRLSSHATVLDIVKEALRLYPPTRRVHRSINGDLLVADIEKCQRFKILAGSDPLVFNPRRWAENFVDERAAVERGDQDAKGKLKKEEERRGFMPFAFHCPSSKASTKAFGFKMIALLVAVLCETVPGKWVLEDGADLPGLGEALRSDREAYGDLRLVKV